MSSALDALFAELFSRFTWVSDSDLFGVPDKIVDLYPAWVRGEQVRGDCDDFAFLCAEAFYRSGLVAKDGLRFGLCILPSGGAHCVCLVRLPGGSWVNPDDILVADNMFGRMRKMSSPSYSGYQWYGMGYGSKVYKAPEQWNRNDP